MYKKIMRPIRGLLIKILFKLLNVNETMKGLAVYEDLQRFNCNSQESIGLTNQMKYRHSIALAGLYVNEDYKNYLYYLFMRVQRDNVQTIEPHKRDSQTATMLWILKHITDINNAFERMGSPRSEKHKKKLKEAFKKAKGRTIGLHDNR